MTWDVSTFSLPAYLERIGVEHADKSVESLHELHRAHVRTIPFENVDVVLGTHPGIGFDAIQSKLVGRQRGGYCYEHALLFAAALEHLGFEVTRRVARVQPQRPGPRTHALLKVRADEQDTPPTTTHNYRSTTRSTTTTSPPTHYVSTNPNSPFSTKLVVMRLDEGISRRLVGTQLTTEHPDGRIHQQDVPPDQLGAALADLDVVLNDEELDRLTLITEPD